MRKVLIPTKLDKFAADLLSDYLDTHPRPAR